jgi:hypothetical protein
MLILIKNRATPATIKPNHLIKMVVKIIKEAYLQINPTDDFINKGLVKKGQAGRLVLLNSCFE